MSGKVINLRRVKKQRKRRTAQEQASTPAPDRLDKARDTLAQRRLDAHKRDTDDER